jgi:cellulose biosynthesis protein BcsQ
VLTRAALSLSDIALLPVDASEMSIASLEELLRCAQHLDRPAWAIVRVMLNRAARRTKALSDELLQGHQSMPLEQEEDDESAESFLEVLQSWKSDAPEETPETIARKKKTFLLRSLVHRTEAQNQLSFERMTSFDRKKTSTLAEEYRSVAREIESLEGILEEEQLDNESSLLSMAEQNTVDDSPDDDQNEVFSSFA